MDATFRTDPLWNSKSYLLAISLGHTHEIYRAKHTRPSLGLCLTPKNSRLSPEFEACLSSTQPRNAFNCPTKRRRSKAWTLPCCREGDILLQQQPLGGNISSSYSRFKTVKNTIRIQDPSRSIIFLLLNLNRSTFVVVDALSTPIYHVHGIDCSEKVGPSPCASPRSWSCVSRRFSRSHSAHKLPPSNRFMFLRGPC